ncbi:MAG TPA: hypothetical protein VN922_18250, partial [Bacteroidia bacterium]|nr:hypothetical protein [Bacteroidia bacterium]
MSKSKVLLKYLFAGLFLSFVVFSATYCHTSTPSAKDIFLAKVDSAHSYLNINDTVKYVGAHTCMLCHQSIYDSFMHTGMGESFDIATKKKSSAR